MKSNKAKSMCCYKWNHGFGKNKDWRLQRLREAEKEAPTLVCDCLTCFETFCKEKTSLEIIDILQLFEEALDYQQSSKIQREEI